MKIKIEWNKIWLLRDSYMLAELDIFLLLGSQICIYEIKIKHNKISISWPSFLSLRPITKYDVMIQELIEPT